MILRGCGEVLDWLLKHQGREVKSLFPGCTMQYVNLPYRGFLQRHFVNGVPTELESINGTAHLLFPDCIFAPIASAVAEAPSPEVELSEEIMERTEGNHERELVRAILKQARKEAEEAIARSLNSRKF